LLTLALYQSPELSIDEALYVLDAFNNDLGIPSGIKLNCIKVIFFKTPLSLIIGISSTVII